MNMQQLAQQAIDVQDACNLLGVVNSYAGALLNLRDCLAAEGIRGSDELANHPVNRLWADKIKSMAGFRFDGGEYNSKHWTDAYDWCNEMTNDETKAGAE
jgi:hypothetical protein